MAKRTVYFATQRDKATYLVVEMTEGEVAFRECPALGLFDTWEKARDVALLRNRTEKRLTFSQIDTILGSVLIARTHKDLVEQGKGWICAKKHYNAAFVEKCEECGASRGKAQR